MPHFVLVDTLFEVATVLPRPVGEAAPSRAVIYKEVPSLFMAYFTQILKPGYEMSGSSPRDEREAQTICQTLDALLNGNLMRPLMILIGRLKALQEARSFHGGGWAIAQHFEVIPQRGSGLVTGKDRQHAMRDHRKNVRFHAPPPGRAASPGRGGGEAGRGS